MADGPSGRRWENIPGEVALRHVISGNTVETKLVAGSVLDWWGRPSTHEGLREELSGGGVAVAILLHEILYLGLEHSRVTIDLDDLIRAVGWGDAARRSVEERQKCRRQIWRWLTLIECLRLIGQRPGRYRDPLTKELVAEVEIDRLIHLGKVVGPGQMAFDKSEPPRAVTFHIGDMLEEHRGNRQFLSDYGDVRRIAGIPAGQPSGAWAQSVGLALNQRWREMSSRAQVGRVGEDKKTTVRFPKPFTRRELLDLFRTEPHFEDVLGSRNPGRAREYWKEAIRKLQRAGVIGHYEEIATPSDQRGGWQNAWLDQPIDIRPKDPAATAEIARSAVNVRRQQGKKRGPATRK